jgi:hypothetical protein
MGDPSVAFGPGCEHLDSVGAEVHQPRLGNADRRVVEELLFAVV